MPVQDHVYLRDTYQFETRGTAAVVTDEAGARLLVLDSNPFHPQGGGQAADPGTVAEAVVVPIRLADGRVAVRSDSPQWSAIQDDAAAGAVLTAAVEPGARLRHAALHTAGHLIHGLLHRRGYLLEVNNHFPGQARLALRIPDGADLDALQGELERDLREAIAADFPIEVGHDGDLRLVTIAGVHTEPCGGTHARSLADLEAVSIRSMKRKSGTLKIGYESAHRPLT